MKPNADFTQRITALRALMKSQGIDFYYVPSSDAHQNEYVPECWQRRAYISGFTGSAGDVLIGLNQAYLWTDGRYFLQAEAELDPNFYQLMKRQQGSGNSFYEFLSQQPKHTKLGVDPQTISAQEGEKLQEVLKTIEGELVSIDQNLISQIQIPALDLPKNPARLADLKTTGQSAKQKIQQIQAILKSDGIDHLIINTLDSIAWLLNIRGNDVAFNPLVISYLMIDQDKTHWFVDLNKLSPELLTYCQSENISVHAYENFGPVLKHLTGHVWIDPASASFWIKNLLKNTRVLIQKKSPIEILKACKNPSEIQGMKEAHIKDAVSLINFLYWLDHEQNWKNLDEYTAGQALLKFRSQDPTFEGPSFDTIAGYAEHSAVIHYRASENSAKKLADQNLFLLDSGGQYPQGTTDITRVFHFGTPSPEQKKHYTLVLKGHLALARAIFVQGTTGMHLDALARQYLWQEGLDFLHGTGHGVGCNLCVHEGPQRISPAFNTQALLPGMVVSNEPGVYFPNHYGIRIENLCFVKEVHPKDSHGIGVGPFLGLEDLTLFPYNLKLIDFDLINPQELAQIKSYHEKIIETVGPKLKPAVQIWLKQII